MLNLGKPARGLFVKLPSTEVIDLVAASSFDFAVIDLEHSQLGDAEVFRLLRHAQALAFPALARIATAERGLVNRLLEAGAVGIHLSTVQRASEVADLRRMCRYAPGGTRSVSLTHPGGRYGGLELGEYVGGQGAGPILVAQIETEETADPLEEILAAGPDVVFLGVTDLAVDCELDEKRVQARVDEVAEAAEAAGIPLGAFALDDSRVTYSAVSTDLSLLRKAIHDA
jgi:2-keto-3-deoxy-L-rhamnonate aldolase RhmA